MEKVTFRALTALLIFTVLIIKTQATQVIKLDLDRRYDPTLKQSNRRRRLGNAVYTNTVQNY